MARVAEGILKTDYGQEEAIAVFGHDPASHIRQQSQNLLQIKKETCARPKLVKAETARKTRKDRQNDDGTGGRNRRSDPGRAGADRSRFPRKPEVCDRCI